MNQPSVVTNLRQHHAIEHATVTLLSQRLPGLQLVARSDLQGFSVFGPVATADLRAAAEEALRRLQAGESNLAVHPNCGTNLVTAGVLSGVAAMIASSGRQRSFCDRLPGAVLAATVALIAAIPLGRWVQTNLTTSPQVNDLRIAAVERLGDGPVKAHRVLIESR